MPQLFAECPRCNEGDLRSLGENRCGLCECRFWMRPDGSMFIPSPAKKIGVAKTEAGALPVPDKPPITLSRKDAIETLNIVSLRVSGVWRPDPTRDVLIYNRQITKPEAK